MSTTYPRLQKNQKASRPRVDQKSSKEKEEGDSTPPVLSTPQKKVPGSHQAKVKSPRSIIDSSRFIDEESKNQSTTSAACGGMEPTHARALSSSLSSTNLRLMKQCMKMKVQLLSISSFNHQGCEAFRTKQYKLAMRLFQDAHKELQRQETDNIDLRVSSSVDLDLVSTNTYIYQRNEFDEGMRTFMTPMDSEDMDIMSEIKSKPVCIGKDCKEASKYVARMRAKLRDMDAIIWFNRGQTFYHHRLLEKSMKCFRRSLRVSALEEESYQQPSIRIAALQTIGQIQYQLGNFYQAIQSYEAAIQYAKRVFKTLHNLSIASALNSLGVLYYHLLSNASAPADMSAHQQASVSKREEEYFQKAKEYSLESLRIRKIMYGGENHPDVATTYNNMGRLHVMKDEFKDAIICYDKALKIRASTLGKESLDYAATAFNAGQSYHHLHELEKAEKHYNEFLVVAVEHFTKNHRDVAVVMSGIAEISQERGDHKKARKLYLESLEAARNALGENHPEIAMILNRLGNFYYTTGDYDAAYEVYSKGLEIERHVLDDGNPNSLVSLCNLGEIHRQRKEWDAAIKIFKEVLGIQRKQYGSNAQNAEIATTLHVIGVTYEKKGLVDSALKFLQQCIHMRRVVLGDKHIDLCPTLTTIGIIFSRGNKLNLAMDLLSESLQIRKANLGENNRDAAFTLYNIALIHQKQGLLIETVHCLQKVLSIEKSVLGVDHKDVAITMFKLGETFKKHNDLERALKYFQQALEIERKVMQKDDPLTIARTLTAIGNIYLVRGETSLMMEAFNEAARIYQASNMSPSNVFVQKSMFAINLTCHMGAAAA